MIFGSGVWVGVGSARVGVAGDGAAAVWVSDWSVAAGLVAAGGSGLGAGAEQAPSSRASAASNRGKNSVWEWLCT
jgi:hypothetical protein